MILARDLPAFRYVDGKLVTCENVGATMHLAPPRPSPLQRVRLTRRERRQLARFRAGPHRRSARRIGLIGIPLVPRFVPLRDVVLWGHRFTDGERHALLYLPEGQFPTDAHGSALARLLYSQ